MAEVLSATSPAPETSDEEERGAPSPTGGVAGLETDVSAQRLTVRLGPVPRAGGVVLPRPAGDAPGAANEAAGGRPDEAAAADAVPAEPADRLVVATGSGPTVNGRAAGVTVAAGATAASFRMGALRLVAPTLAAPAEMASPEDAEDAQDAEGAEGAVVAAWSASTGPGPDDEAEA